jgi:hypothetical protein
LVPDVARPPPAVLPEMSAFPAYRSFISAALRWCRWPPSRYSSHFPHPRCWPGCRFRRFKVQVHPRNPYSLPCS